MKIGPCSRHCAAFAHVILIFLLVGVVVCGSAACGAPSKNSGQPSSSGHPSTSTGTSLPPLHVGLVIDIGGLHDRGFNQLAYMGYERARQQFGFKDMVIQPQSENEYLPKLIEAAQSNDLVIGVGFFMAQVMDQVAQERSSPTRSLPLSIHAKQQMTCLTARPPFTR